MAAKKKAAQAGAGAFAATFAGPYFGGCAALARHQSQTEAVQRHSNNS